MMPCNLRTTGESQWVMYWLRCFELSAGMEVAAAGIDEVYPIKVARRQILDRIGSILNVLEKLFEEVTDLLRRDTTSL
jgi:hypothetical protein